MIYIQSIYGKEFSQKVMNNNFNIISSKINSDLKTLDKVNSFFIDTLSNSFSKIDSIKDIDKEKEVFIKTLTNILNKNEELYSSYFAFSDNSFFEIINLNINKTLREQYLLTKESRWLLIYIDGNKKTKSTFYAYDKNLNLIKTQTNDNTYFATTRPWYKKAEKNKNKIVKTKPYFFNNIASSGMTYSKRYGENVTFSLDILLDNLKTTIRSLNSIESMNTFLFSEDKELIISSTDDKILISKIKELISTNTITKNKENIYEIDSEKYILNISQSEESVYKYLITIIEIDDVMKEYIKYFNLILIFTILLFLSLLPIIWYFASVIVKPVLELKLESKKIRDRKYSELKRINSRVYELQELSNSVLEMGQSICEYQNRLEQKVEERTKLLRKKNIELEKLSITDNLTGIYNRIKLDEVLINQLNRANCYKEIFGVIMIDIDYFKKVNDTYGHQVGDITLIEISKLLQKSIRSSDTLGRWGGEEFMIICPHTDLIGMKKLANNIRIKIENYTFPIIKNKTASFGITIYKENDNLEKIISRADNALYVSKDKGRNRVESK